MSNSADNQCQPKATTARQNAPIRCYCDADLSCGACGHEQPYTDISVLKARVEELEKALRPFANFSRRFGLSAREDGWQITNNPSGGGNLTMGDCRKAEDVLPRSSGVAR